MRVELRPVGGEAAVEVLGRYMHDAFRTGRMRTVEHRGQAQPGGDLPVPEAGQDMARDDGAFPVRERAQQPQQLALYFVEKRLDRKRSIYNKLA